jgi:4-amino-4-deoxy-L-arabinose transferase-like glycosyltransferase
VRILLRRFKPDTRVLIAGYALLLLIAVLLLPLRIEEMLHLLAARQGSFWGFINWLPRAPGSAPLSYFVQAPFILLFGASRFGARFPSLLFGLGSCYLFLRLAKNVRLRQPYIALAVFAVLPTQYWAATQGLPFEQALFLLLLATLIFLQLIRTPTVKLAAWYAAALTLCIYTERLSCLPSIGYLLFLFAFVNRSHERRVIWCLLPATAAPVLLFVPYYLWARPLVSSIWLSAPLPPGTPSSIYLQALLGFAGDSFEAYILSVLLIVGLFAGVWGLFRITPGAPPMRVPPAELARKIALFCLFGGALSTIAVVLVLDIWNRYPFHPSQVLWAMPAIVTLTFVALDRTPEIYTRPLSWAVLILLCIAADARYASTPTEDLRSEAQLVGPELYGDSCVVFVSERLSRNLFLLQDPSFGARECHNFFHHRIVLASHAYVTPFQQEDAESFFRGLNFTEFKRIRSGGGQIIVMIGPSETGASTPH